MNKRTKIKEKEVKGAVNWLIDEVSLTEYAKLVGVMQATSAYVKIAQALREAYKRGIIKLNE